MNKSDTPLQATSTLLATQRGPHPEACIIHADLDAFYASVEQRDNPTLIGRPVVVGGAPNSRGVVAACSYEARGYGIHSAMPLRQAYALCPNAIFLEARHAIYQEISHLIMDIFHRYTPIVEPIALDEAFLDVFGCEQSQGSARAIAQGIKESIKAEHNLTISVGIATSKSVAKIASEMSKPDGLITISPGREKDFLSPLSVGQIWGVGPRTEAQLANLGIQKVEDLTNTTQLVLMKNFGKFGQQLYELAQGIDPRPVSTTGRRKSMGKEQTFSTDLDDPSSLSRELLRLSEEVAQRLRTYHLRGKTLALKIRLKDFTTLTRRCTLADYTDDGDTIYRTVNSMLLDGLTPGTKYRLLGVYASNFDDHSATQMKMPLFQDDGSLRRNKAIDHLESKFGKGSLARASIFHSVARYSTGTQTNPEAVSTIER